eukprot:3379256-Rhodomonas_salina.1
MSSTNTVCGAICLRLRYAMSGTDEAYGAICLRLRYACPALKQRMAVPGLYKRPPNMVPPQAPEHRYLPW